MNTIITINETLTRASASGVTTVGVVGFFPKRLDGAAPSYSVVHTITSDAELNVLLDPEGLISAGNKKVNAGGGTVALAGKRALSYLLSKGITLKVVVLANPSNTPTDFKTGNEALFELLYRENVKTILTLGHWISGSGPYVDQNTPLIDQVIVADGTAKNFIYLPDVSFSADVASVVALAAADDDYKAASCAVYWPGINIDGVEDYIIPGSVAAVGVFAVCDRLGGPWLIPAGVNRGKIANALGLFAGTTQVFLSAANLTTLGAGFVNTFRVVGSDIVLFDEQTNLRTTSLRQDLYVQRLLQAIYEEVDIISLGIQWEYNNPLTWNQWRSKVNSYLTTVQSGGAIVAYLTVMDLTTMTQADILAHKAIGKIVLQITGIVKEVTVNIEITDSEVTFQEVANE